MTDPVGLTPLQTALLAIAADVGYVAKDGTVDVGRGYKYASAEAVLAKVRKACQEHGVAVTQSAPQLVHHQDIVAEGSTKSTAIRVVRMTQTYSLGQERSVFSGLGEGKDNGDKATMKANTAALKYLLASAFNISWGDDPEASDEDGNKTTKPRARGSRAQERREAAQKAPRKLSEAVPAQEGGGTLENRIAAAATLLDLMALKPAIKALDREPQQVLREAFVVRKDELEKEAASAERKAKAKAKRDAAKAAKGDSK